MEQETLTVEDLKRIFIRAQKDDNAQFVSVSCYDATDLQFDTWAKSRIDIQGESAPWSLEERANFCTMLHSERPLVMLKKGVTFDEEE